MLHLTRIFQILCYNLVVAMLCGTLAGFVINYTYTNVNCDLIEAVLTVHSPQVEVTFKNSTKQLFVEPDNFIEKVENDVPFNYRLIPGIIDTS